MSSDIAELLRGADALPDGWQRATLGELAELSLGKMLDREKNKGELRLYLANMNVRWGGFDLQNLREMRFEERELERYGLRSGDIVMCEGGEPGRCALWNDEVPGMMIQKALHRIRPIERADSQYLYYALANGGQTGGFDELMTGSGIKHLPGNQVAKVEVWLPPLDEQRRIARVLRSVDEAVEAASCVVAQADEAFEAVLADLFCRYGDASVKLEDYCLVGGLQTGPFGSQLKAEDYVEDGVPVIMPVDLTPKGMDFVGAKKAPLAKSRELARHILQPGDVLFARRGEIGRCGLYLKGDPHALCGTGCLRARLDTAKIDPVLAYFLIQSRQARDWLCAHAVGATMPNLNTKIIGELPMPDIPIDEQGRWVDALLMIEGTRRINQSALASGQITKSTLMSDLLSGRMRVLA